MASRVTLLFARTNWAVRQDQLVQQFGDGGGLVRLAIYAALSQHEALGARPGADDMQRDCSRPRSNERRIVLPSMATTSRSKPAMSEPAQAVKPASKASGSISMNTRPKVSCEGMPFGSSRKVRSQSSLLRPYKAMSSQLSAQAITAHTAITRMAVRRCSILPPQRGSATAPKCCTRFLTGITRSCSSFQEQVIRYQPRSADKNFMRRPCGMTQFGRALDALNIEIICANSSQAKGRVERAHKTLQDRLVKELRLAGASNLAAGNALLPAFMADYNARFAKPPANGKDLHRPLRDEDKLEEAFAWKEERTLSRALTLQYDKVVFVLAPTDQAKAAIGKRVTVLDYPDGRLSIRYKGVELAYRTFDKLRQVSQAEIVENKRLGAVLAVIREQQIARAEPRSKKAPRRRDQSDARLFKVG